MSDLHPPKSARPHYADHQSLPAWVAGEIWDHLWPWSRNGFAGRRFLLAASLGLAALVTLVWLLAAAGRIGHGAVIGWWVGWSVFEVLVRLQSKPYIKDGAWWGRNYRPANWMDMICYVSFKNLLLASLLFLTLRAVGVVNLLPGFVLSLAP
ncbi:MAG TPA: transcription regulator [Rhodocyclaceae bacterium]